MNGLNFNTFPLGRACWLPSVLVAVLALLATSQPGVAQQFTRRTQAVGLERVTCTNVVAVANYVRDGDLDVYFVVKASYDPIDSKTWKRLFANRGMERAPSLRRRRAWPGETPAPCSIRWALKWEPRGAITTPMDGPTLV